MISSRSFRKRVAFTIVGELDAPTGDIKLSEIGAGGAFSKGV